MLVQIFVAHIKYLLLPDLIIDEEYPYLLFMREVYRDAKGITYRRVDYHINQFKTEREAVLAYRNYRYGWKYL